MVAVISRRLLGCLLPLMLRPAKYHGVIWHTFVVQNFAVPIFGLFQIPHPHQYELNRFA